MAEVQTKEFDNALASLGIPFANLAAESDFDFYKTATQLIEENREAILYWEFVVVEAFKRAKDTIAQAADYILEKIKSLNEEFQITDTLGDLIKGIPSNRFVDFGLDKIKSLLGDNTESSIFDDAQKDLDNYIATNDKARTETKKTAEDIAAGLSYSLNRIRQ